MWLATCTYTYIYICVCASLQSRHTRFTDLAELGFCLLKGNICEVLIHVSAVSGRCASNCVRIANFSEVPELLSCMYSLFTDLTKLVFLVFPKRYDMLVTLTNIFEVKVIFTTASIPIAGLEFLLSLPLNLAQSFIKGKTCCTCIIVYDCMLICNCDFEVKSHNNCTYI